MNLKRIVVGFAVFVGLLIIGLALLQAAQRRWPNVDPVGAIARILTPDDVVIARTEEA